MTLRPAEPNSRQRGSALVLAVFVLALLTMAGLVLLSSSRTDLQASLADLRGKKAFYLAEAALETARDQVRVDNSTSADRDSFDDELAAAAGPNGRIDFDETALAALYDSSGQVVGFAGFGDDVPVVGWGSFGGGWNAAFVTNDPVDGKTLLDDGNDRVLLTAVGAGKDRSLEVVQAVIEKVVLPEVPAAILLLGPAPIFDGGDNPAKDYVGDDCQGAAGFTGIPGGFRPVIGTVGPAAKAAAEAGVHVPATYRAGALTGVATVVDLAATLDPRWTTCSQVLALARAVRASAQFYCTPTSPCTDLSATDLATITYVEGDAAIPSGRGLLWITGTATVAGDASWDGVIVAAGKGRIEYSAGGAGHGVGASVLANVAGPDEILFTGDDCSGGTAGFQPAAYIASGGGNEDTVYCSDAVRRVVAGLPYRIASFRER
jgi:hypothetical protein